MFGFWPIFHSIPCGLTRNPINNMQTGCIVKVHLSGDLLPFWFSQVHLFSGIVCAPGNPPTPPKPRKHSESLTSVRAFPQSDSKVIPKITSESLVSDFWKFTPLMKGVWVFRVWPYYDFMKVCLEPVDACRATPVAVRTISITDWSLEMAQGFPPHQPQYRTLGSLKSLHSKKFNLAGLKRLGGPDFSQDWEGKTTKTKMKHPPHHPISRETGTICQIGVLTAERSIFGGKKNGDFRPVRTGKSFGPLCSKNHLLARLVVWGIFAFAAQKLGFLAWQA